MTETSDFETVIRAFKVFDGFDGPSSGLWWRTDKEYAPVTLLVNCNDVFFWGCSDCERLTPENIGQLERALEDARAADPKMGGIHADILWIARERKQRPQGAYAT